MEHRDAQITIIMGRNGTGKSTVAESIIKAVNQRAVAVTLNGAPKIWRQYPAIDARDPKNFKFKKGIKQVYYMQHDEDTMKYLYKNFTNGILLFDDCRGYLKSNVASNVWHQRLLMDFRHRMLDIFYVVHSPKQIPPQIWGFTSAVWVGATPTILPKSVEVDGAEQIRQTQMQVNELFRKAKSRNDGSHYGIFKLVVP